MQDSTIIAARIAQTASRDFADPRTEDAYYATAQAPEWLSRSAAVLSRLLRPQPTTKPLPAVQPSGAG